MSRSDLVDIEVIKHNEDRPGLRAILVSLDEDSEKVWLPMSQIEYEKKPNTRRTYIVTMPLWLAESKELV